MKLCMFARSSFGFPQFSGPKNDAKHRLRIGVLVGSFAARDFLPTSGRSHVYVRQVLSLG
jgi:hypothetical protein